MAAKKRIKRSTTGKGKAKSSSRSGSTSTIGVDLNDDEIQAMLPRGLSRAFVESKIHAKKLKQAGLDAPEEFEGEMPELPEDVAAQTHDELSNIMLAFQSALSTATWQASMWYIEADIMEEIADYLEDNAILASEQSNEQKRKAEARTDEQVVFFRAKYKIAYHNYVRFRDMAKDLTGKVKAVSRVAGFKDDDEKGSDATARPRMGRNR